MPPWSRLREQPDSRPEVRRRSRRVSRLPQNRASRATGSLGRGCPGGLTEALLAHCRKWELRSRSQLGRHRLPSGPAGLLHAGVRGSRPGQGRRGVPSLHPGSGGPGRLASRSLSVPPVSGRAGCEGPGLAHWRPRNPHSWGSASFRGSPLARTGCRARTGGVGVSYLGRRDSHWAGPTRLQDPATGWDAGKEALPLQTGPAWAAPSPTDGPSVGCVLARGLRTFLLQGSDVSCEYSPPELQPPQHSRDLSQPVRLWGDQTLLYPGPPWSHRPRILAWAGQLREDIRRGAAGREARGGDSRRPRPGGHAPGKQQTLNGLWGAGSLEALTLGCTEPSSGVSTATLHLHPCL